MCRPVRDQAICRCTLGSGETRLVVDGAAPVRIDDPAPARIDGAAAAGTGDRSFSGTFGQCRAGDGEPGSSQPCRPDPGTWVRTRNAPDGAAGLLTDFDLLPCRRGGVIAIIVGNPCDASAP